MPLEFKGFSAHICCDGKELEQYDVQQEDERTVTCWVPSESGKVLAPICPSLAVHIPSRSCPKSFSVHWKEDSPAGPKPVQVLTLVDGRCICRYGGNIGAVSGLVDRPGQTRPLLFSPLKLTGTLSNLL